MDILPSLFISLLFNLWLLISVLSVLVLTIFFVYFTRKDVKKSKEMRTYWREQFKEDMADSKYSLLRPHTVADDTLLRVPEGGEETLLRPEISSVSNLEIEVSGATPETEHV